MNTDPQDLIDGYFDEVLTPEQFTLLSDWIKSSSENAKVFAKAAMLHDRLRNMIDESSLLNDEAAGASRVDVFLEGTVVAASVCGSFRVGLEHSC